METKNKAISLSQERTYKDVAKELGVSQESVRLWCKKEGKTRPRLGAKPKQPREGYEISTVNLAYLVAVLMGDGYVSSGRIELQHTAKDVEFGRAFQKAFEKQFGLQMHIFQVPSRPSKWPNGKIYLSAPVTRVRLCSTVVGKFLETVMRPEWVRSLSSDCKIAWLRGIWDSEGSIQKDSHWNSWTVKFKNLDQDIVTLYREILKDVLNVDTKMSQESSGIWQVWFTKIEYVVRFYEQIQPVICRKRKRFEEAKKALSTRTA